MAIKAFITAVSNYDTSRTYCNDLPLCKNDLYAVQYALVYGLNIDINNIKLLGQNGIVKREDFINSLFKTVGNCNRDDTFIFYFSGHGGNNPIVCSDGLIELQSIVNTLDTIEIKNKIIIFDCCYSGDFNLSSSTEIRSIEDFVGHGCAVMASCGANEVSGFNSEALLSTYTSFLCDAFLCKYLVRQGRKSLEDINEALCRYITVWNSRNNGIIQQPIFRSNIVGTIFFNVEDYVPYKKEKIYSETEKYIIYDVESVPANVRRLSAKVILRFKYSENEIAEIVSEINNKIQCCNVYFNETEEARFKNQSAKIIWCYIGYDEDDMINCNYACISTWTDDTQDRDHWYGRSGIIINDIHFSFNSSYETLKKLMQPTMQEEEFIKQANICILKLISVAERYIVCFREFLNGVITEQDLISSVLPLNKEITDLYYQQSDLPAPPNKLHDWFLIHSKIAGTIHDFSLYYSERGIDTWSYENRKWLMTNALNQYAKELEELKQIDKTIK